MADKARQARQASTAGTAGRGLAWPGLAWPGRQARQAGRGMARQTRQGRHDNHFFQQLRQEIIMSSKDVLYQLRHGKTSNHGVSAKTIADNLSSIARKNAGGLTPPAVLDAARPEASALHPVFEWEDAIAAEQHRLHQARHLIRSVQIISPVTKDPRDVYAHCPSLTGEKPAYHPVQTIVNRPDLYLSALTQLQNRVHEANTAVKNLAEAAQSSGQKPDKIAQIGLAASALRAAHSAIQMIH